jgi:purine catabolism regulator
VDLPRAEIVRLAATAHRPAVTASTGEVDDRHPLVIPLRLGGGTTALAGALRGRRSTLGWMVLIGIGRELVGLDAEVLQQAVQACAIDIAREEAMHAAHETITGGFLDSLLRGTFASNDDIERRGRVLGYDLSRPHAVLAFRAVAGAEAPSLEDLAATDGVVGSIAIASVEDVGIVLAPLASANPAASQASARCLARRACAGGAFSIGVGAIATGGTAIAAAVEQARQALTLGDRLHGPGAVTAFEDLGLYRLLFGMREIGGTNEFIRDMLGGLIAHDRRTGGELLQSLDAYLACGASPTAAAERLHLHRNGMLYRLQRIRELVPIDLDDAEQRLGLHLALRLAEVIGIEAIDAVGEASRPPPIAPIAPLQPPGGLAIANARNGSGT